MKYLFTILAITCLATAAYPQQPTGRLEKIVADTFADLDSQMEKKAFKIALSKHKGSSVAKIEGRVTKMDSTASEMKYDKLYTLIMKGNIVGRNEYEVVINFKAKVMKDIANQNAVGEVDNGKLVSNRKIKKPKKS